MPFATTDGVVGCLGGPPTVSLVWIGKETWLVLPVLLTDVADVARELKGLLVDPSVCDREEHLLRLLPVGKMW